MGGFPRGAPKSLAHMVWGGQNPYIYTNSQFYHYCFCHRGGQTPMPTSMGGPWPDLPPPGSATGHRAVRILLVYCHQVRVGSKWTAKSPGFHKIAFMGPLAGWA